MYSGISLEIWASVSSTVGLEDFADTDTVKMTMRDIETGLRLAPGTWSGWPPLHALRRCLYDNNNFNDLLCYTYSLTRLIFVSVVVIFASRIVRLPKTGWSDGKAHIWS